MSDSSPSPSNPRHGPGKKLWLMLILLCIGTVLAGSLLDKHGEYAFPVQELPAYPAWIGLGAGLLTVILSRAIGLLLQTREDYYDEDDHSH